MVSGDEALSGFAASCSQRCGCGHEMEMLGRLGRLFEDENLENDLNI
jgi:hypothetical protein